MFFWHSFAGQSFVVVVLGSFFLFGNQKKELLVALDRWFSYAVTLGWEFAWTTQSWSVYRGGRLNRFDCNALS